MRTIRMRMWTLRFMVEDAVNWLMAWPRLILFVLSHRADHSHVGLSLSFCVKDILEGRERRCGHIISSTKADSQSAWDKLYADYCAVYWSDYPIQAWLLVEFMKWKGCVEQPRLQPNGSYHNICHGHWLLGPVTREEHRGYYDNGDVLVGSDGTRSGEGRTYS